MSDIQGVSGAVNEAGLRALMERTGYPIEQKSGTGQRIYGPPPQGHQLRENGQPGRGCEVFVGKLPRDCFEDELVPILEKCGPLYEVRMMMDFTGSNRGFCFATYGEAESARRATRELNNYEIRPGCHIGVCQSVDNCRLFLGGIPRDKQRQHILEAISKLVTDVKDVIVKPDPKEKHKNRGFAFVEFYSHHSAAMARRKLAVKKIRMWDQEIAVDWAEPEPEIDKEIMDKVKVLYFYNLTLSTTEQAIEKLCVELLGKSGVVERVRKLKDYAFVHFKEREDAIQVMKDMDGKIFDGSAIKITLAKPAEKKAQLKTPQPIPAPGLLVTPNGTIILQQSMDPATLANSKEASLRNPLVMGVKDGSKGRARGAGGIGKVYSRSSSLKRPNVEQLKLTPLNEFVTGNPVLLSATQVKSAVQALEEALRVRGLGSPQYEVTTSGTGDDTTFFSRVYLQSLNLVFQNNRACKFKEESCEQAAFLALKMIEERMPLMPVISQYCPAIFPGGAHPTCPPILPMNPVMMERIPHHEYILQTPYIPTNGSQILMAPQALMVRPAVEGQLEMSPNFYPVVQNGYILGQVDDNNNHTFSINQPSVVPMVQQPYNILLPLAPPATNATLQVPVSHNA